MNNPSVRSGPIRFRELPPREDGQPLRIEGYFVVFNSPYYVSDDCEEIVDPHAFDGCDMSDVRALLDHDSRLVLGRSNASVHTLRFEIDDVGLYASIDINEADSDAMNAYARVMRRDVDQASFGFWEADGGVDYIDLPGGRFQRVIRRIAKLDEITVCTFPAYQATSVSARSADSARIRREVLNHRKETLKGRFYHGKKSAVAP